MELARRHRQQHFFLILFWKAKLYTDAILRIVYIVISIFGWWNWVTLNCPSAKPPRLPELL